MPPVLLHLHQAVPLSSVVPSPFYHCSLRTKVNVGGKGGGGLYLENKHFDTFLNNGVGEVCGLP